MYKVAKKSAYKWCPDKELGRMGKLVSNAVEGGVRRVWRNAQ